MSKSPIRLLPKVELGTINFCFTALNHLRSQIKGQHLCMTKSGKLENPLENELNGNPWLCELSLIEDEDLFNFLSQFKPLIASQKRSGQKNYPPMRWSLRNGLAVYSWLPLNKEQEEWCLNETLKGV
jgi:hypothetical protein